MCLMEIQYLSNVIIFRRYNKPQHHQGRKQKSGRVGQTLPVLADMLFKSYTSILLINKRTGNIWGRAMNCFKNGSILHIHALLGPIV